MSNFSLKYDELYYSCHECLQFLYIRNFNKNEIFRRIPLNYFPTCLSISNNENYIAIGTKEGLLLFITRIEMNLNTGFNLDIFSGHYDFVKTLSFSFDSKKCFSGSYSEMIVWNIK